MNRIVSLVAFFILLVSAPALAQTGANTTAQQANPESAQFQKVEELQDELEALEADRRQAQGEERKLIAEQIVTKRAELGGEIATLVDSVTAPDASTRPEVKSRAKTMLRRERSRISKDLEQSEKALQTAKERAANATNVAERTEAEEEIARINERFVMLLGQQLENTQLRKRLGADVASDMKQYDRQLETRARRLSVLIEAAREERSAINARPAASDEEKNVKKSDLATANKRIDAAAASLRGIIDLMKERDLDTTSYQRQLIEATGKVTTDVFDSDVSIGLLESAVKRGEEWVAEKAAQAGFALILFAIIVIISWLISRLVRKIVRRSVDNTEMSQLARDFVARSSGRAVIAVGLLTGLSQLGIELGPVLAGLGIAGFVVGFALQDTLSNFASGLMILVYRPFDVGDLIEVSDVRGTVDRMTLVSTSILTLDNQLLIVPNNKIWNNVIRNVTSQSRRRVDFLFGIGYEDDIDKAAEVLRDIVVNIEHVDAEGEIIVEVHELGDSSVNFVVRVWTETENYWNVFWAVNAEVKRRFDKEGISIPFPQRDVHIHNAA